MDNYYGVVDKKVLFALMDLADEDNIVKATLEEIANHIGYKSPGGAITWAIRLLNNKNKIKKIGKSTYKVLV